MFCNPPPSCVNYSHLVGKYERLSAWVSTDQGGSVPERHRIISTEILTIMPDVFNTQEIPEPLQASVTPS
jgi:hypothetical protein